MSQPARGVASRPSRSTNASSVPEQSAPEQNAPAPPAAGTCSTASDGSGAAAVARDVTDRHSFSFTIPGVGQVWLGEPKHLPFYVGVAALASLGILEWPVAAVVAVGKLLAENAHREILRDFGSALEAEA